MNKTAPVLLFFLCLALPLSGQDNEEEFSFDFDDPFSVEEEAEGVIDDPFSTDEETDYTADEETSSFDSLFDEEAMIEEIDESEASQAPEEDFLVSEKLTWGGRFNGTFDTTWNWNDLDDEELSFLKPDSSSLTPEVTASLFFDGRPASDFRVFGKLKFGTTGEDTTLESLMALTSGGDITSNLPEGWTSAEDEEGNTVIYDAGGNEVLTLAAAEENEEEEEKPGTGTPQSLELSVFELFSDFTWQDTLFVRFGKHTIRWGTGYFWSPADVLNLTAIDTEDPTAEREGPVSLKLHVPFGLHNGYLYLIANDGIKPSEVAVAPKAEFFIGNTELSLGGYYQKALSPRIIAMATGPLGDFDLFSEVVLSYGSDRTFVRVSRNQEAAEEDPEDSLKTVLDTFTVNDRPFLSATCGFNWIHSFEEPKLGSMMVVGQYFFNGEGYADSSMLAPAYRLLLNSGENGLTIDDPEAQPEGYEDPPALAVSDLMNFGQHYGALIFNWSNLFDKDFSFSTLVISNLTDLSFILSPNISFTLFEKITLTLGARITFGAEGGEFTDPAALISGDTAGGGTLAFSLTGSVGGGSF